MRVADMISMLQDYQAKHGPDAQMSVLSTELSIDGRATWRRDVYIHEEPIATYLDSQGPEVEW